MAPGLNWGAQGGRWTCRGGQTPSRISQRKFKAADAPEPGAMALVDVSRTCQNALVEGIRPRTGPVETSKRWVSPALLALCLRGDGRS